MVDQAPDLEDLASAGIGRVLVGRPTTPNTNPTLWQGFSLRVPHVQKPQRFVDLDHGVPQYVRHPPDALENSRSGRSAFDRGLREPIPISDEVGAELLL